MTRLWLAAGTQSEAAHVHSRWTSVLRKPGCLSARPGRRGPCQAARLRSRIRRPALHSDHLGLSPRILGRWGRKPKSRIVGPRKQGAWGLDGTPAGHPHSGAAPATVRPAPRPRQASPSPPLTPQLSGVASNPLWDRAESECYPVDGGLSEPHRGRRGPPGRWTAAAKRKARLARKPARPQGLTPFPRKQGAPVAPPHVEPLRRSASAQRL